MNTFGLQRYGFTSYGLGLPTGSPQPFPGSGGTAGLEYRPSTDRRTIEREDDEMLTVIMAFMRLVR